MSLIFSLFFTIFYQPLFNLLVWLYNVLPGHDLGLAIIALTVLIKLVLYPLTVPALRSQRALQSLQPKIDALKAEYKDNKEAFAAAVMKLYKEEKVNPLSSCLPILLQFPFLIALYHVFQDGLAQHTLTALYPFVSNPGALNPISLGLFNLAKPNLVLAVLAGGAQFIQTRMLMNHRPPMATKTPGSTDENMMAMMNKQMLYVMPLMTIFAGAIFPSGLPLYWLVNALISALQQHLVFRKKPTT